MAKTYADYMAQIESIRQKAEAVRQKEIEGVVARIREAIDHYGLTPDDVFGARAKKPGRVAAGASKSAAKRARQSEGVKYRDESGNTWGGRGPRPRWLREALATGRSLDEFAAQRAE